MGEVLEKEVPTASNTREPRLRILLVEDDVNDVELLRLAFRGLSPLLLDVVSNGREAVERIADQEQLPDLILCDLNMPVMNGFEFLKWLKRDSPCRRTPLVVLTSSVVDTDLTNAYDLGAAAYLVKPSNHKDLVVLVNALVGFWRFVHTPPLRGKE